MSLTYFDTDILHKDIPELITVKHKLGKWCLRQEVEPIIEKLEKSEKKAKKNLNVVKNEIHQIKKTLSKKEDHSVIDRLCVIMDRLDNIYKYN